MILPYASHFAIAQHDLQKPSYKTQRTIACVGRCERSEGRRQRVSDGNGGDICPAVSHFAIAQYDLRKLQKRRAVTRLGRCERSKGRRQR